MVFLQGRRYSWLDQKDKKHGPLALLIIYQTLNPFVPNAPFLYSLKTLENLKDFWCFQEVEKRCIGNEWVKMLLIWYFPGTLICLDKLKSVKPISVSLRFATWPCMSLRFYKICPLWLQVDVFFLRPLEIFLQGLDIVSKFWS